MNESDTDTARNAGASLFTDVKLTDKTAIIFDMDGVVIDSEALHERASRAAFSRHGIDVQEALFVDFKGKTERAVVEYVLDLYEQPAELLEEVLELKRLSYASFIDELQPIPGVMAFLKQVVASHRLALTTSASRRNQTLAFEKFDLHPFFEVVITSNDITRPKPDPEPYLVTAERLGLAPEACLVIEDSTNGVRSAAAAGCVVVGITTSFESDALAEAGADAIVESYEQLLDLL